jgi:hypothetical protein
MYSEVEKAFKCIELDITERLKNKEDTIRGV